MQQAILYASDLGDARQKHTMPFSFIAAYKNSPIFLCPEALGLAFDGSAFFVYHPILHRARPEDPIYTRAFNFPEIIKYYNFAAGPRGLHNYNTRFKVLKLKVFFRQEDRKHSLLVRTYSCRVLSRNTCVNIGRERGREGECIAWTVFKHIFPFPLQMLRVQHQDE